MLYDVVSHPAAMKTSPRAAPGSHLSQPGALQRRDIKGRLDGAASIFGISTQPAAHSNGRVAAAGHMASPKGGAAAGP